MKNPKEIRTINEAQAFLDLLYPNVDRDIDYIYGYLSRNSGYLCKHIWQEKVTSADFIKSVSWLLAFSSKVEVSLEDAFISRFPGVCPYCITSPCDCRNTKKSPSKYIPAYKVEEELSAKANVFRNTGAIIDFDFVCRQSDMLYPNNLIIWEYGGPWRHLVKIQEEVAEIHEATSGVIASKRPRVMLEEEVADAFAWILSAWRIVFPESSFQDEFINYYRNGCPVCITVPCECAKRAERSAEFVDPSVFVELRTQIELLTDEIGLKDSEIDELKKSLEAAEKNQSEPVARGTVNQARRGIEKIEGSLDFAEKNSKKAASLMASISKILDSLPF